MTRMIRLRTPAKIGRSMKNLERFIGAPFNGVEIQVQTTLDPGRRGRGGRPPRRNEEVGLCRKGLGGGWGRRLVHAHDLFGHD